jgi:glycosyltransferase involved in cell wall biosynthesis
MEQHIGHQTYYQNLRQGVELDAHIQAIWAPITYTGTNWLANFPGVPRNLWGTLQGMFQVRDAIAGADYDVAFFNTQVPAALASRQVRRRPYVLATDITPIQYDRMSHLYGHKADRSGLLADYKQRVNITLLRGASRLLPWSNWTRESLIQDYGVTPERIDVVPPGVDLRLWTPGTRPNTGPLRILFVGGDLYRKGGATLLKAFRALPRGVAELHLVTRTPIVAEEGVHIYHAMQPNSPELIALYQSSDVFVLPTEAEAFGIAAIEASASGLAIVATAIGGLGDIVSEGENGFLVQPKDDVAVYTHLSRLAADPDLRSRMGYASRVRAEARFDARRNAARVIEHLCAVANNTSR